MLMLIQLPYLLLIPNRLLIPGPLLMPMLLPSRRWIPTAYPKQRHDVGVRELLLTA
jgi:hypothetical protein